MSSQAKSIAEPFAFEEYRKKRIQDKIEEERANRVKLKVGKIKVSFTSMLVLKRCYIRIIMSVAHRWKEVHVIRLETDTYTAFCLLLETSESKQKLGGKTDRREEGY